MSPLLGCIGWKQFTGPAHTQGRGLCKCTHSRRWRPPSALSGTPTSWAFHKQWKTEGPPTCRWVHSTSLAIPAAWTPGPPLGTHINCSLALSRSLVKCHFLRERRCPLISPTHFCSQPPQSSPHCSGRDG